MSRKRPVWVYEHALWNHMRDLASRQSDQTLLDEIRGFAAEAARLGITSAQSMPIVPAERLRNLSAVPIRIRWIELQLAQVSENPRTPVKYIFDGTPIERGAAFSQPYSDRPGVKGAVNYSDGEIGRIVAVAARDNQQLLVHLAGDVAPGKLFAAMKSTPADWPARRVRVEHGDGMAAFLDDAKSLGVVVVQNPSHFMLPDVIFPRLGGDRARSLFPFRTLIDRGIPVAIGSDGPLNPWLNVMFATIHATNPAEAVTREQALILYTRGSAYAEFAEHEKGTLTRGKLADLAVLSQDIFSVPTEELPRTASVLTIVGGKVVHEDLH